MSFFLRLLSTITRAFTCSSSSRSITLSGSTTRSLSFSGKIIKSAKVAIFFLFKILKSTILVALVFSVRFLIFLVRVVFLFHFVINCCYWQISFSKHIAITVATRSNLMIYGVCISVTLIEDSRRKFCLYVIYQLLN